MFDHAAHGSNGHGRGLKQLPGRCDRMLPDLPDLHVGADRLMVLAAAMTDPSPHHPAGRNPGLPFGYALFGRFVEVDLGFDPAPVETLVGPAGSPHAGRPPRLELDCVFGRPGGEAAPRIEEPAVSALAPVFRHAHAVLSRGAGDPALEEAVRHLLVRHYHWIVLEDYLPRICDPAICRRMRRGATRQFRAGVPFLPAEWRLAARHLLHAADRQALGRPAGWDALSGLSGDAPRLCRRFGPCLDAPLPGEGARTARLLLRGDEAGLPSGQSVARALGVAPLDPRALAGGPDGAAAARLGLLRETPLWFYLLKEAEVAGGGLRLGPAGSHIVIETLLAVVEAQQHPIPPRWRPGLPGRDPGRFDLADLLALAGAREPAGRPAGAGNG